MIDIENQVMKFEIAKGSSTLLKSLSERVLRSSFATAATTLRPVSRFGVPSLDQLTDSQQNMSLDLYRVAQKADRPHWDGEGSSPVNMEAVRWAGIFIQLCMPNESGEPEVYLDSDGEPCFEWVADNSHRLMASVSDRGVLSWCRVFGSSKFRGSYELSKIEEDNLTHEVRSAVEAVASRC